MDRASLKIFARLRGDITGGVITTGKNSRELTIHDSTGREKHSFDFYRVLSSDTTQQEVFDMTVRPLLETVKEAYDASLLVYGPTNSGKTYTVLGEEPATGMLFKSVEHLLESFHHDESKHFVLKMSILDLYADQLRDLGLGYIASDNVSAFASQNLDVVDVGKRMKAPATEIELLSAPHALEVVKRGLELREAYEAQAGKYSDKTHTIYILTVGQSHAEIEWSDMITSSFYIADLAGSQKSRNTQGKDYYNTLNISSSLHSLSKVLSSLNSGSVSYQDHKLTKVLEHGLAGNSNLIVTVNPSIHLYEDTLQSLSYSERCKPNVAFDAAVKITENAQAADSKVRIQKLQDEAAELKEKLKNIEAAQDEQMKAIANVLGLEQDPEVLLNSAPGSKALAQLNAQKEAVQKIDSLIRENRELEKRIEERRQVFDKLKRMEYTNQEKHIHRVLELKDELTKLKDQLAETKAHAEYTQKEHIEVKTHELQQMLTHSQILTEEKANIVQCLPMQYFDKVPEQDMKELGRLETEKEYAKRFQEQERSHQQQVQEVHDKYQHLLNEKDKALNLMVSNFKKNRTAKKKEIQGYLDEMKGIYKIVQQQVKVIDNIKEGKYNQKIKPVYIPFDLLPQFPDASNFPHLFKHINPPTGNTNETDYLPRKELASSLFVDPTNLTQQSAKKLLVALKDTYAMAEKELTEAKDAYDALEEEKEQLDSQISNVREERNRYRELYSKEINNRKASSSVIENQRKVIEKNLAMYSRPSSQGKWKK